MMPFWQKNIEIPTYLYLFSGIHLIVLMMHLDLTRSLYFFTSATKESKIINTSSSRIPGTIPSVEKSLT